MSPHRCEESRTCICYLLALEPNESCPQHGHPYPPRCETCGRYMKVLDDTLYCERLEESPHTISG